MVVDLASCVEESLVAEVEGARQFQADGGAYDRFMGRYSRSLAPLFADWAGVEPDHDVVDVGCGPGALTEALVARLGRGSVTAIDPSPSFVEACSARCPAAAVQLGRAEELPVADRAADRVLSQLVLHFVTDADAVAHDFTRVLRPGGVAAACVWDFAQGMEMLRLFWDAALAVRPDAPDEATTLRFGGEGEIADLFASAGMVDVDEHELTVESRYEDFDELWSGFLAGIGPAGAFCVALGDDERAAVRGELFDRLDGPTGPVTLQAVARAARGRRPDG